MRHVNINQSVANPDAHEGSRNGMKRTSIVEILDFDLKNVKEENTEVSKTEHSKNEDHTMELELKVEIEPDTESSNRLNASESSSSKKSNEERARHYSNISSKSDDPREQPEMDRPLPPPLISKPIGTNYTPLSPSHPLQPPPLMMNPRLSSDGKTPTYMVNRGGTETTSTEEEIVRIKNEIREDIQSELMNTSEEIGGIGNAVAASFMTPFPSVGQSNIQSALDQSKYKNGLDKDLTSISPTTQSFQTNTTSLLPRSMTNNQMYISKLNSFITTSSYVNLPLCTPNATVSFGPRPPFNPINNVTSSAPLRIDTSGSTNYQQQLTEQRAVQDIERQVEHQNGSQNQQQPTMSNANTLLNTQPVQSVVQNAQPLQMQCKNNEPKSGIIGQNVRDRLVKHLEDKNGELQIQASAVNEMPPLVNYSDGQFSPSPNTCNKGPPGRIISIVLLLSLIIELIKRNIIERNSLLFPNYEHFENIIVWKNKQAKLYFHFCTDYLVSCSS
jgi:hypothetical protein